MITFDVMTLFPEWIETYCQSSILGRAQKNGLLQVNTVNPRQFTTDAHHTVDDAPYGGGAGMVMMCQPIMDAFRSIELKANRKVLLTSPVGKPFHQDTAKALSHCEQVVILCGHYEGIDERIKALIPEIEPVSIGDFVLTGGELAALCMIDTITRLRPGVLGTDSSSEEESFSEHLLEYPHYTRPQVFEDIAVPDVLLSGNHAKIAQWRRKMSLLRTMFYRPDLIQMETLSPSDQKLLNEIQAEGI